MGGVFYSVVANRRQPGRGRNPGGMGQSQRELGRERPIGGGGVRCEENRTERIKEAARADGVQ